MSGYFLDTSALAKLYHQEDGSQYLEQLVTTSGSNTFISRLSLVELESVFAIKIRTGELNSAGREMARRRLRPTWRKDASGWGRQSMSSITAERAAVRTKVLRARVAAPL